MRLSFLPQLRDKRLRDAFRQQRLERGEFAAFLLTAHRGSLSQLISDGHVHPRRRAIRRDDSANHRGLGRKNELPAIDALEHDVIDPSSDQSTAAVLDKISGAAVIGARQRQARIQLLVGMVEQLLVDSKQARDTDTAALAMQIVTWRDGRAAAEAFVAGSLSLQMAT
jgi:hypothetical protein